MNQMKYQLRNLRNLHFWSHAFFSATGERVKASPSVYIIFNPKAEGCEDGNAKNSLSLKGVNILAGLRFVVGQPVQELGCSHGKVSCARLENPVKAVSRKFRGKSL